MTFLPIIERELRVRARRPATYWTRFAVGVFGVLICLTQLTFGGPVGGASSVGRFAFSGLVTAAFLLCCGACALTADAISSERREGTLGLLFLTRVRGHDVLLGKLGAAGLTGLCAVIVFLPVLMIPVLSGGVTGGEAFRKGLVLLNTLFVGLVVGLWASARGGAGFVAFRRALLILLCLFAVPALFDLLTGRWMFWGRLVAAFSPWTGLSAAGDANYRASPAHYWEGLLLLHLLGWCLLWRAGVVLRRSLREPRARPAVGDSAPAQRGVSSAARRKPAPLTEHDEPIAWLVRRQPGLALTVWVGVAVGVSYWLLTPFVVRFGTGGVGLQALLWPISLVTQTVKTGLFAWVASRFFIETRRTGELELLVTTPHGAPAVVSAQWQLLKRLFRWPVLVLVLPMVLQAFFILVIQSSGLFGAWRVHYVISTVLSGVNTWVHVVALCWVGMWFGLRARNQSTAIIWTVGLVALLPQMLGWMCNLAAAMVSRFLLNRAPMLFFFFSSFSSVFVLMFYLWLIHWTRKLLSGDLRLAELQPVAWVRGLRDFWRDGTTALRSARHWTPS